MGLRPRDVLSIVLICCVLRALPAAAQQSPALPAISRAERHGEFVSTVGRRAALLGTAEGRLEAWVYPLKILRDLHLRFHIDDEILPAEPLARNVITRPESTTIVYTERAFQVRETIMVPIREPGATITFEIQTERPLEIEIAFKPDFQLEWPGELGPSSMNWDSTERFFLFQGQNHPYAALIGSPTAHDPKFPNDQTASASEESSFLLGATKHGKDRKFAYIAASLQGQNNAAQTYGHLVRDKDALELEARNYYSDYLRRTLNIDVPDPEILRAYDWARINLLQGMVDNPLAGTGLIAGYGPSGETQRPGYDWFFGRDALWSSLALDSEGDFADVRTVLEFLAKFQRSDGKIPHEIPQSATLVPWFENYPYGYAAADATPLFLIAMCDYVQSSGDLPFANDRWDNLWRAYQFLNSTLDADGFAQNSGAGHGWVESGPLVPVRTEIYQAGLGIEALRATSTLARLLGKSEIGATLEETFERDKNRLNEVFWSADKNFFAFAIDAEGQRVDEETVLPAVPMWFGLLDPAKAGETISHFAGPDLETDWGMRIVSSSSPKYASDGYHFGSVWPLFTGWASAGEYRYHRELDAYLNLRANALLALDGSPGHVTEVLNGDYYEPLSTSTPQQIWSAAMIVSPLLRGLFGLEAKGAACEITLAPHLPSDWNSFGIHNLQAGGTTLELRYRKDANNIWLDTRRTGKDKCTIDFSPALSLRVNATAATLNGRAIPYRREASDTDQHISVRFEVPVGRSTLRLRISDDFEFGMPSRLPASGSESQGLRIISTTWTAARDRLDVDVAGMRGNSYELKLSDAGEIVSVEGAELNKDDAKAVRLVVRFPSGSDAPDAYVRRRISMRFTPTRR